MDWIRNAWFGLPLFHATVSLLVLSDFTPRAHSEEIDLRLFNHLRKVWAADNSKIKTASIQLRRVRRSAKASISRQKFERFLEKTDLHKRPDDLRHVSTTLVPEHPTKVPWGRVGLSFEGKKVNEVSFRPSGESVWSRHVFDGNDYVRAVHRFSQGRRQVDIRSEGGPKITRLSDLLLSPQLPDDISEIKVVSKNEGKVTLNWGTTSVTVDTTTGYIYRLIERSRETVTFGPVSYPDGITFYAGYISVLFREDDTLRNVDAVAIEKAVFNKPLGENEFIVPLYPRDVVVDYRFAKNGRRGLLWRVEYQLANALGWPFVRGHPLRN